MNEQENLTSVSSQEQSVDGVDYIQAISELKATTVPRDTYEELKGKHKQLLEAMINGNQVNVVEEAPEKPNPDELRKELFGSLDCNLTNLEFVSKALELRDAVIESGGTDPFLPVGRGITVTREDVEQAELAAETFKECIEYANGNS